MQLYVSHGVVYEAICKICQHMKNHEKSFFLHGNFAGQQLIHISYSPDIELGVQLRCSCSKTTNSRFAGVYGQSICRNSSYK